MKEIFKFDFDFLGQDIQIIVMTYKDIKEVKEFMEDENYNCHACFCVKGKDKEHTYIIFSEDDFDSPYIYTHELLHATSFYLREHFKIDDEEVECYFLGYLCKIYCDFLATYKQQKEEDEKSAPCDYYTHIKENYDTTK
jgi:hypothetical protein